MENALTKAANKIGGFIVQKSPTILLVLGVAGCISAAVIAIKETPKAMKLLDERKEELETEKLDPKEIVKTTWKLYLPVVITGMLSIACIIFSHSLNERRKAALATAYTIAETSMLEFKNRVREAIGEEKELEIEDQVNNVIEEKFGKEMEQKKIFSGYDDVWILEPITGQEFLSSENKVREIINDLNEEILDGFTMSVDVNEYLLALGLNPSDVFGDKEWHIHNSGQIKVYFPEYIKGRDGKPLLVMKLRSFPRDHIKYGD